MSVDKNEFESLFQRASEHYPLNTDSANWNAVLEKLEKEGNQKGILLRKRLLYLLILLVVSILSAFLMHIYMNGHKQSKNLIVPTLNEQKESETKMLKKITDAVYEKVIDSIQQKELNKKENIVATLNKNNFSEKSNSNYSTSNQTVQLKSSTPQLPPQNNQSMVSINQEPLNSATQKSSTNSVSNSQETKNVIENKTDLVEAVAKYTSTDSTTAKESIIQPTSTPVINIKKALFNKYFYTGAMYATDKSSINFEASKGSGYSMALVLGYQFSKRFSVETGIHIEKKEYYTKGEHFDKSILPATGKILWIESENKLIEIPVSLKTDLLGNQRHQLFGSFGISSFLVNNESYEYEEEINGVIQSEYVEFTKNTSNLFATVNMSLGYEYKIKNRFRLRIEPYLNLPLSGIGKGKEPVLSKGIYFGLLYNFHKK
ncbi:MAG: hypothetical protein RLY89_562 [Bacteroidota bacterium]|jgi:hypothetical protein